MAEDVEFDDVADRYVCELAMRSNPALEDEQLVSLLSKRRALADDGAEDPPDIDPEILDDALGAADRRAAAEQTTALKKKVETELSFKKIVVTVAAIPGLRKAAFERK